MASIAQLVSEFAHSLHQPNNKALRENIRLLIVHTRNEIIRRSYENHRYVDKGLTQRFKVSLTTVNDGDIILPEEYEDVDIDKIKRSVQKVPRPVRLTNNLPFDRVSSVGYKSSREFPYIKETSARFRSSVPGLCGMPCYDYINGYIYIFPSDYSSFDLNNICIEGAFEHPTEIQIANGEIDSWSAELDENEWLLSEDMIGQIKDIVYKRDLLTTIRETNEIPNSIKYN
uniref:Structural protein n=1 Tax=Geladintestivirus 2 TaxID=3233134 RepID=A0AAU8MGN5_9CAUD